MKDFSRTVDVKGEEIIAGKMAINSQVIGKMIKWMGMVN